MQKDALNNVHITDEQVLITPDQLKAEFPLSVAQEAQIEHSRQTISDIIAGRDPRLLVVCGPCSIHDPEAAIEYARRFKALAAEVSDSLYLVMRVYFEKPRTTVGWKGLINDPHMDGSFDVEAGLKIARRLLVELVGISYEEASQIVDRSPLAEPVADAMGVAMFSHDLPYYWAMFFYYGNGYWLGDKGIPAQPEDMDAYETLENKIMEKYHLKEPFEWK